MAAALTRCPAGTDIWSQSATGLANCPARPVAELVVGDDQSFESIQQLVLTADARIDNRTELIDQLGWGHLPVAAISNGALILGAYARWGQQCPEHLLGDYAFVLWDARRQILFGARDHLGIKPFYYHHTAEHFAFSSEIKSLLALPWLRRRIDETRVADFLMGMAEDGQRTFYDGILRLPAAHCFTVSRGGLRLWRYWQLDPNREIQYATDEEYAEAFRALFLEAVRCRMQGGTAVGSFLSGGLDSSAITCVARDLLHADNQRPLDTFSLVFDDVPKSDERPYIQAVLDQGGLRSHFVFGDRLQPFDDLDRLLRHVDEPFITPNLFFSWNLYRKAEDCGIRFVLDGLLGDTVVSHGTRYLTELAATGRWLQLTREIRTIAGLSRMGRRKAYRQLWTEFVLMPLLKEPLRNAWSLTKRLAHRQALSNSPLAQYINNDFARRIGWEERAREYQIDVLRTHRTVRAEHYEELTSAECTGVLEVANKAAAACGVTLHFPFADRRLVEFCLAIPATQKYQQGWTRTILRRGLHDYLPEKIRTRYGKQYWHHGFHHSLYGLAEPQLREFVTTGELTKFVSRAKAGPEGMTVFGPDDKAVDDYLRRKPTQSAKQREPRQK